MISRADRALIARSFADRLPGVLKAALALGLYAFVGSWVYSGFANNVDDLLLDFPEELTALMGGGLVGATGGYITSVMFSLIGPLVFVALAVSWGAAAIAGEESARTARLLFAQPITRRQVLLDRSIAMGVSIAIGVAGFAISLGVAAAAFGDNGPTPANVFAAGVHLTAFATAVGMISLAAGSATGSKAIGVAAGGGIAALSYFINSFGPLTAAEGIERFTPWYLYNGSAPIDNGIDGLHIALLLALAAASLAVGVISVSRRDLEAGSSAQQLPLSRFRPAQRVSTVYARTASARVVHGAVVSLVLFGMAVTMSLLFSSVGDAMADLGLPESIEKALGGSSIGSPVGWMNSQLLTIVAPIAVLSLAISMGIDAVAGERERRTLLLVLTAAPSRRRFVAEKLAAIATAMAALVVATAGGLWLGSALGNLELALAGIVGASLQLGALGMLFGAASLALGVIRSRQSALSIVTGVAIASFLSQALLSAVDGPQWLVKLSPWEYYIGNNPLGNGASLTNLGLLVGITGILVAASLFAFDRSDAA